MTKLHNRTLWRVFISFLLLSLLTQLSSSLHKTAYAREVEKLPDLDINLQFIPPSALPGDEVRLNISIQNQGEATAKEHEFSLMLDKSLLLQEAILDQTGHPASIVQNQIYIAQLEIGEL